MSPWSICLSPELVQNLWFIKDLHVVVSPLRYSLSFSESVPDKSSLHFYLIFSIHMTFFESMFSKLWPFLWHLCFFFSLLTLYSATIISRHFSLCIVQNAREQLNCTAEYILKGIIVNHYTFVHYIIYSDQNDTSKMTNSEEHDSKSHGKSDWNPKLDHVVNFTTTKSFHNVTPGCLWVCCAGGIITISWWKHRHTEEHVI